MMDSLPERMGEFERAGEFSVNWRRKYPVGADRAVPIFRDRIRHSLLITKCNARYLRVELYRADIADPFLGELIGEFKFKTATECAESAETGEIAEIIKQWRTACSQAMRK